MYGPEADYQRKSKNCVAAVPENLAGLEKRTVLQNQARAALLHRRCWDRISYQSVAFPAHTHTQWVQVNNAGISMATTAIMCRIEEGKRQKQRQRSSLLFGGQNLFNSLPRQQLCIMAILKNRKNSSFSSNHPGAFHPILQISLMQFILSFKSS